MLATSKDMKEVADSMKTWHPSLCHLPLLPNSECNKLLVIGECLGPSLPGSTSSLPYLASKVGETCDASACDGEFSLNAPVPTFGKFEMQASEACQKSFMIFDQSATKNTLILHPSWLNSRSSFEPYTAQDARDNFGELQAFNNKAVEAMCSFHSLADPYPKGTELPAYREAMGFAVVESQQEMATNGFSSVSSKAICSLMECLDACQAQALKKSGSGIDFPLEKGQDLRSEFHEDTLEIDALLSSDDELSSTGHSPSGASSNCCNKDKRKHGNGVIGNKRKLQYCIADEDDDADSGFGKPESDQALSKGSKFGSWLSLYTPIESNYRDSLSGVDMTNLSCRANKGLETDFLGQVDLRMSKINCGQSSGTFGEGGLADSAKRIKIKAIVQQLKNVIPGGDCLDTAGVLGRAIQYVECLQNRLRDLAEKRELRG